MHGVRRVITRHGLIRDQNNKRHVKLQFPCHFWKYQEFHTLCCSFLFNKRVSLLANLWLITMRLEKPPLVTVLSVSMELKVRIGCFSQENSSCALQESHSRQEFARYPDPTRSPFLYFVTLEPTSVTTPTISWLRKDKETSSNEANFSRPTDPLKFRDKFNKDAPMLQSRDCLFDDRSMWMPNNSLVTTPSWMTPDYTQSIAIPQSAVILSCLLLQSSKESTPSYKAVAIFPLSFLVLTPSCNRSTRDFA